MLDEAEKGRRLDKYVTLVQEFLAWQRLCTERWPKDKTLRQRLENARRRMKRRRVLLIKDGVTEKELEAAYVEAAVTETTQPQ